MGKRFLAFILGFVFFFNFLCLIPESTAEETKDNGGYIFHGHAEINQDVPQRKQDIFTGEHSTIDEGTKVKMTVSSVLSAGYTEEGDEFFAEIVEDVEGENGVVIPMGSIAHGTVTRLENSKRLGRDGYIVLNFDSIITPDGREIPVEAHMTTKPNPVASVGKTVLKDTGYMLGGGVIGGLASVQLLGVGAAVASHGYTVVGGAGLGAVVGLGYALGRKGKEVLLQPGDEINVKILGALKLPVLKEEAYKEKELKYDGLDIRITNYKIEEDPFGDPNIITLSLVIENATQKTFSSFDFSLVNDYKNEYHPTPFTNTEMWFNRIKPNDKMVGKISFFVDNPKRKYWLVLCDPITREQLVKVSLDNVKRDLMKQAKADKKKKRRK